MKNYKGQMKSFAWTFMWATLLFQSLATDSQNIFRCLTICNLHNSYLGLIFSALYCVLVLPDTALTTVSINFQLLTLTNYQVSFVPADSTGFQFIGDLFTLAFKHADTTESKQIEVQIARTRVMSTKAPENVTRPQQAKGTNLQMPGIPTFSVATSYNNHVADLLSNDTIVLTDNSHFPEAPVTSSLTQRPNLSILSNITIATFLLHNISVTLRPFSTLPILANTTQASIKSETNLTQKLTVNNSLIPALQPIMNHSVSLAFNSSQYFSNVTTDIRSSQGKISKPKPMRKKTGTSSIPKLSRNNTIAAHQRLMGGKNVTKVITKPPKQRKVTTPTKKPQKSQRQQSSKPSIRKPKPDQMKKRQKVKKRKNTKTGKSRVKQTSLPYFEDYYCPPQCACYGRIVQCSDKGLSKIPYGIPFNTRNLFLMNNKIDLIPLDLLNEYMLLEFLVLNNNMLTDIGVEGALEGMQKLTRLYMDQNKLSSVPTDLPPTLKELMLNSNNISMMSSHVWAKCKNLKIISLNNNKITDESIPPGAFKPVPNLHVIKMNHNLLTAVPDNLSTNLRELYLEGNQIRKMSDKVFTNSSALIYLSLHDNQLNNKGIGEKAFQQMSKLEYLDLSKNALTAIPKLLPHSMKKLILQDNSITSVRKNDFQNMLNLEEIYLAHNQISLVTIGAFRGLAGLRCLDLSHNQLLQVPRQLPLTLQYLYLHSNQIAYIPRDALCGHQWAKSHLILVRLEKNNFDHQRQVDVHALRCLRGYQVIHFE